MEPLYLIDTCTIGEVGGVLGGAERHQLRQ